MKNKREAKKKTKDDENQSTRKHPIQRTLFSKRIPLSKKIHFECRTIHIELLHSKGIQTKKQFFYPFPFLFAVGNAVTGVSEITVKRSNDSICYPLHMFRFDAVFNMYLLLLLLFVFIHMKGQRHLRMKSRLTFGKFIYVT